MCDGLRLRARAALVLALVASSQGDSAVGGAFPPERGGGLIKQGCHP